MDTIAPRQELLAAPTSLDVAPAAFRADLDRAAEIVVRLYAGLDRARLTTTKGRAEIAALFDEPLPEDGQPMTEVLRAVEERIIANSALALSPRFFAYVNGCGNQAAVVADLVASAVNQIPARWHFSPAATEVERRVVRWIAELVGYRACAGGCLLSGGSAGNLVGLALARTRQAPFDAAAAGMRGGPALTVYTSSEGHASVAKGMALLGFGREQLRTVAVRDDFTIDPQALAAQVERDRSSGYLPICVVGNAGTTNTGAVDPLDALADLCQRQSLWFHVDAAYGGPAAATAAAGALFHGLERADSVVVNPPKWLFMPVEVSCILVRDAAVLRDTFEIAADYLQAGADASGEAPFDFKDHGPQLSRSFRALKVWMTLKAYGARRIRAAIESNIEVMRYLADRIDRSPDFVRLGPVPLSTVCFQYRTMDAAVHADPPLLDALNGRLAEALERDGRVFLSSTTIRGRKALRACSVNHRLRRADVDLLLDVIRDVARPVVAATTAAPS